MFLGSVMLKPADKQTSFCSFVFFLISNICSVSFVVSSRCCFLNLFTL